MAGEAQLSLLKRLSMIPDIERKRYQLKGLVNTVLGFALLFGSICISREIGVKLWPEDIEDKTVFFWKGAILLHFAAETWTFLLMLPGYTDLLPYYQKYKINKGSAWPWHRPNWPIMKRKLCYNLAINQLFIYPLFVGMSGIIGVKQRFIDFPTFGEILTQIIIIYLLDDLFFYWGHRTFHYFKALYKMHKIHHEYDKVFTFTTEYFHPLDYAVANVLPGAMGLMVLGSRVHCFTYFFWIVFKVSLSTEGHSGYQFTWSPVRILPFIMGPSYHDHHHSHNVGNYSGSCYLWDLILGTGDHFFKQFLKEDSKITSKVVKK